MKNVIALVIHNCGVGLVVECLPSKQETGVRFSYAAQNKERQRLYFVGVAHELLHVRRESNRGRESASSEARQICDRFSYAALYGIEHILRCYSCNI